MTFEEVINLQMEFDANHKGKFHWDEKITNENIELLEFLLIAIVGEVGETSNIVKKILRGDFSLDEKKSEITEEIVDIFIYLIKMSYQLEIDLVAEYINKMKKNKEKFEKYECKKESKW